MIRKIVHLTSVHRRYDPRIFLKECVSLARKGYDVTLCVADGKVNEIKDGVSIIDASFKTESRLSRMTLTAWKIYRAALSFNADLYHLHDPELIPAGLLLLKRNKLVVYDVHEDVPRQTLGKHYMNCFLRPVVARTIEVVENFAARRFSAICTATPFIRDRFLRLNRNTVDINNFPRLDEFARPREDWSRRKNKACYVGVIAEIRGALELIDAMDAVNATLDLAGNFSPSSLREKLAGKPGWSRVNELGFIDRSKVKQVLSTSKAGVTTLHPLVNYVDAFPVKMFEYMAAGIPVVASDFPVWKEIVEGNNCGLCVDPLEPEAIANAINTIMANDDLASTMGQNGRKAVENNFSWEIEEEKLISLYEKLLQKK